MMALSPINMDPIKEIHQVKKLIDYAVDVCSNPDIRFYNLQSGSQADVVKMLELVRTQAQPRYKAPLPSVAQLVLTENDGFNVENPGDVMALLFETVVRVNRNPTLWHTPGAGGAAGEINTTLNNFTHGPSTLAGSPEEGVKAASYSEALKKLEHIVLNRGPF